MVPRFLGADLAGEFIVAAHFGLDIDRRRRRGAGAATTGFSGGAATNDTVVPPSEP